MIDRQGSGKTEEIFIVIVCDRQRHYRVGFASASSLAVDLVVVMSKCGRVLHKERKQT